MGMKQEPIIFNFKPGGFRDDAPALADLRQVTLLINPETVTIPWKKNITRVRTKSRIVSLYWGQEPLTLTYKGQTGNLYPIDGFKKFFEQETSEKSSTLLDTQNTLTTAQTEITRLEEISASSEEAAKATIEDLQYARNEEYRLKADIAQLSSALGDLTTKFTDGKSHTELIKLSPKYQKFDTLRKLYEQSQTVTELMYVKYRDWLFEGYFENFNFTDDAKSPWNWTYNLTFTILNWNEHPSGYDAGQEYMLVSDIDANI